MIVNSGKNLVRNWLAGDSVNPADYMAIGTGSTSPQPSDTALQNEVLRKDASESKGGTGEVTYTITVGSSEANGNDLQEVGLFNASSGGTMLNRITFTKISKTSDIEVKFEIKITVTT